MLLLSYALPSFLQSQRAARLKSIFHDLEQIVDALQNYRVDYHQLPPRFYTTPPLPGYHIQLQLESRNNNNQWEFSGYTVHKTQMNWEDSFPVLYPEYLASIPQKLSEYKNKYPSRFMIRTYHLHTQSQDPAHEEHTFNWGIAVTWPFASQENQEKFKKVLRQPAHFHWRPSLTQRYYSPGDDPELSPLATFIDSDYYYATSNGLKSNGFLYLDLVGNHSPRE